MAIQLSVSKVIFCYYFKAINICVLC